MEKEKLEIKVKNKENKSLEIMKVLRKLEDINHE
jgi:hypothetical protein